MLHWFIGLSEAIRGKGKGVSKREEDGHRPSVHRPSVLWGGLPPSQTSVSPFEWPSPAGRRRVGDGGPRVKL
jgi:hypothetical protein